MSHYPQDWAVSSRVLKEYNFMPARFIKMFNTIVDGHLCQLNATHDPLIK